MDSTWSPEDQSSGSIPGRSTKSHEMRNFTILTGDIGLARKMVHDKFHKPLTIIRNDDEHLMDYITEVLLNIIKNFNQCSDDTMLFTNNVFVLSMINNCIMAAQVGKTKKEEVIKILSKQYWLDPDLNVIKAYEILKGKPKSIMTTYGLIGSSHLDRMSERISIQFGKLLDLSHI